LFCNNSADRTSTTRGGKTVEDDRAKIEDYMHRYGYDEMEAEAVLRLRQARRIINEIYQGEAEVESLINEVSGDVGFPKIYAGIFDLSNVKPHFDALENLMVRRALDRQYPEGWGKAAE
jgi:hypothetical protein